MQAAFIENVVSTYRPVQGVFYKTVLINDLIIKTCSVKARMNEVITSRRRISAKQISTSMTNKTLEYYLF